MILKIPQGKTALYYMAIVYFIVLNTHHLFFEPSFVSPIKVFCMALAPLLFVMGGCLITKALFWGVFYWFSCLLPTLVFHAEMRFSTIGYLGLFVAAFIVYYTAVYCHVFTFATYKRMLKWLILAYAICLVLQQMCCIVGLNHFPLLNMMGNMKLGKLPSLSLEPSHTAVILSFAYLCYLRCLQLELDRKPTFKELFIDKDKWVSIGFLWTMLTMGSGTAYLGVFALTLYFLKRNNAIVLLAFLAVIFAVAPYINNKQLSRATKVFEATLSGDSKQIAAADGSGASRIVPLLNTFTKLDLTKQETWFGHGTVTKNDDYADAWKNLGENDWFVLYTVRQYGLIAFIFSILLMFTCCILRPISLETLLWFTLGMATLGNVYLHWGIALMMVGVRYFQKYRLD